MAAMAGGSKPLRLKDLLELDCESCSAAGFRCYPRRLCGVAGAAVATTASSPMRHLLDADALRFGRSSRSTRLLSLSKSLSRRLGGGFWRRREEEEKEAAPASSPPAPALGSSCSCSSDSETSESSSSTQSQSESSEFSSASSESLRAGEASTTGTGDDHEVTKRESEEEEAGGAGSGSEADDKEQLSPVGVMDFPLYLDDEDGGDEEEGRTAASVACCASFSDSLARLQRRKMQLQQKIRRLGGSGELGGVDLEARFTLASSEPDGVADDVPVQLQCFAEAAVPRSDGRRSVGVDGEDPDEYSLLDLLVHTVSVGVDDVTERLLLDFFVETRCSRPGIELHAPTSTSVLRYSERRRDDETLRLARAWLEGTGKLLSLDDVAYHGEVVMAEMERSRRWMHTGEEEGETAVVVAAMVIEEVLHGLVSDLVEVYSRR